jgi:hypothetical protein
MTITQESSTIKIERLYGRSAGVTILVKLDGSPSRNVLNPGVLASSTASESRELVSTAVWNGNKLKISTAYVTTTARTGDKRTVTTIETLSLDGENLVVERSDEGMGPPPGAAPPRAETIKARLVVYKRAGK